MSDAGTTKVGNELQRAREALAEAAKIPTPSVSTYAELKDFVSKARTEVVPGIGYYKATDITLITLQNRDGKKVQIDARLIPEMVEAAQGDTQSYGTKTFLANAQTAIAGYAESIEKARAGRPQSAPAHYGVLRLAS